jgi:hypothetical protein
MKVLKNVCLVALSLAAALALASCDSKNDARSNAQRVNDRTQLVGGPTALGEVGDYLLENDKVRIVVQDLTFNRGSGLFGGSLIDADLRRFDNAGNGLGGSGRDTFGELFPVFFLEMMAPEAITVINDGKDGKAAIVEVKGRGGEFITMLRYLNQIMLNSYDVKFPDLVRGVPATSDGEPQLEFATRYILEPGARHVRIESSLTNISAKTLEFPSSTITGLLAGALGLQLDGFRIPTGHVLGFGALSSIFIPGVGYDLRFGLDDAYQTAVPLPGFPGLLTNIVASSTKLGINYGFATVVDPEHNFVAQRDKDGLYDGRAKDDDMLFLFYASGFGGVFTSEVPESLAPVTCSDELAPALKTQCEADRTALPNSYTFTNYFIIGDGDVASIYEELYKIRGINAPKIQGRIFDEVTHQPLGAQAEALIYSANDASCANATIVSQVFTNAEGFFDLNLAEGKYCFQAKEHGRPLGALSFVEVGSEGAPFINLTAKSAGHVEVRVTDPSGLALPAKLSLVGVHDFVPDTEYRKFLYDLRAGESWKPTDLVADTAADPSTRRFLEDTVYGDAQGRISIDARPGKYTVVVSRGPEYDLFEQEIDLKAGKVATVSAVLNRVVDTTGYLAGDFHIHAAGSIDSGLSNSVRVRTLAGEGVELAVATDHNYVTDYRPFIAEEGLEPWMTSMIGLELTTFEAGHFNAFPVERKLDSMSRGSIKWQDVPPQTIFNTLREMGPSTGNIIQVNHPRTPILGYFYQHNMDPFSSSVDLAINTTPGIITTLTSPTGPAFIESIQTADGKTEYKSTFSWDFDAIEVFNGKHLEELRHFRMPFDKNAAADAEDALPVELLAGLREQLTADQKKSDDITYKVAFLAEVFPDKTPTEIEALTDVEIAAGVDVWVFTRVPEKDVIVCDGESIMASGGLDDYYNLLNYARPDGTYRKYTATGNSDTHKARIDEGGYPRNYTFTGIDEPIKMESVKFVKSLQEHNNIVTNGPFINMTVNDKPIGSEFSASGEVDIDIVIRAADWVGANRLRIVANGETLRGLPGQSDDMWGWVPVVLENGEFRASFKTTLTKDTWFVLEVTGDTNMFPVLTPQDIPPFNFDAVIGSLAGAFGFGGGVTGLEPETIFPMTAFAFTNPIWVVADGDGEFTPPNPPVYGCQEGQYLPNGLTDLESLRAFKSRRLSTDSMPLNHEHTNPLKRRQGEKTNDLRMLFESFGHIH